MKYKNKYLIKYKNNLNLNKKQFFYFYKIYIIKIIFISIILLNKLILFIKLFFHIYNN